MVLQFFEFQVRIDNAYETFEFLQQTLLLCSSLIVELSLNNLLEFTSTQVIFLILFLNFIQNYL